MKIQYFPETDTIYMELTHNFVTETVDLNENTLVDLDDSGNVVAITLEHASELVSVDEFSFQRVSSTQPEKVLAR